MVDLLSFGLGVVFMAVGAWIVGEIALRDQVDRAVREVIRRRTLPASPVYEVNARRCCAVCGGVLVEPEDRRLVCVACKAVL